MRAGQRMPQQGVEKMRAGLRRFWEDNPEWRQIAREEALERWRSPAFRERMARWWTPERRDEKSRQMKAKAKERKETA